jgi:broad-specificity NMP kinase
MGKYFITGRPGVGKSYVTQGLSRRGLATYDLEEVPGIIQLEDKMTGEPVKWPDGYVDWEHYAWRIQAEPLKAFLQSADSDAYFSGSANNQTDFYHLFDKVFVLTLQNSEELRYRLETRSAHEKGQHADNIDRAVGRLFTKQTELLSHGGIDIDNSRPLDEVLDHIIDETHVNK